MDHEKALAVFENFKIRRVYGRRPKRGISPSWTFSPALIQQPDFQTARKYWNKLKERLKKEGSQSVTNCHRLKLEAADREELLDRRGRAGDPAAPHPVGPQPKGRADQALARQGRCERRMQDMSDPARSLDRAREYWRQHRTQRKVESNSE